jgi:uncharacterized membrane protein
VIISLVVVAADHFYELFHNAFTKSANQTKNIVAMCLELGFFAACIIFVVTVYFGYYNKKYRARLSADPKIQKALNYEFRVLDG